LIARFLRQETEAIPMNLLIFGATGMVGQGVLRECLLAADVRQITAIGREPLPDLPSRVTQIVKADLFDYGDIEDRITGFDACFFCLGVSSGGMSEEAYTHLTYDLTMAAAEALARLNPQMTFVYVSGAGTDATETGRTMWARVKGKIENALQRLPFAAVFLLRPGIIQPLHGIRSKTRSYRLLYTALAPVLPVLRRFLPDFVLTTEVMGKAMLEAARIGKGRRTLGAKEINDLARGTRR
jgi:uncharacterized protein YbjT (DUF2867 family)